MALWKRNDIFSYRARANRRTLIRIWMHTKRHKEDVKTKERKVRRWA